MPKDSYEVAVNAEEATSCAVAILEAVGNRPPEDVINGLAVVAAHYFIDHSREVETVNSWVRRVVDLVGKYLSVDRYWEDR